MISSIAKKCFNFMAKNHYFYGITPQFMHPLQAELLLDEFRKTTKRTKTVCTIGPKTQDPINAGILIDQGLTVARLNFSHGDHAQHRKQMLGVQQALKTRPHAHGSILLDTKGPQIRTGINLDDKPIFLDKGQLLELTTDYTHKGTKQRIACSYQDLATSVKVGRRILFADGNVSSIVKKIDKGIVTVQILNDGKLGSKKNMCLPGCQITLPTINKYDEYDIVDFGLKYKVDYIAVSFARYKSDLVNLRKYMIEKDPQHGPNVHLISKIQNHEGIQNIDEIIAGSDGIMVARGDLGMEVPIQKVVLLQKYIMGKTIDAGKYSVCATQMLQSMESKPRPTRAEVSDITNAVLDLTDATMTSGQTTTGLFPSECVKILRQVSQETELTVAYKRIFEYKEKFLKTDKDCLGAIALSFEIVADLIFLQTDSVSLINKLSSLRPRAYIIVFTDNPHTKSLTAINFGVYCYPKSMSKNAEEFCGTVGKGFLRDHTATILQLKTDKHNFINSYNVIRIQ